MMTGDGIPAVMKTLIQMVMSDRLQMHWNTDGDGIPDYLDMDDDNDGIIASVERR